MEKTEVESRKEKRQVMINKAHERLGETNTNRLGSKMWITRYGGAKDIDVEFENGYTKSGTHYSLFHSGAIVNPYDISVYGHGYIGEGKYRGSIKGNHTPEYIAWKSMLNRCYSSTYHEKNPTYIGCYVCDEWLNFQNFAKWYSENYYTIDDERMELDKDVLVKGNKVYSPDACVYVPYGVNRVITKSQSVRGRMPIGVAKSGNRYLASCNDGKKKSVHLGSFSTPEEAFRVYKEYKEGVILRIANEYKGRIPDKLYNALSSYCVELTD